jgi:hypothetical protein
MVSKLIPFLPLLSLWVAVAALASLVIRELGWARVKQYSLTLVILALALLALPGGAVMKLGRPYEDRILAILQRRKSPSIGDSNGCPIFPANNIWNARVRDLPLDPHSPAYIESMGPGLPLHPDFGATGGIPYAVTDGDQLVTQVTFGDGAGESDPGPYRIPDDAPLEGGEDSHVLVLDRGKCMLYELYSASHTGAQQWQASSGAIFNLRSNQLRPLGWTSADAAGLPILPGLARYEEVKAGRITHALRFSTRLTRRDLVWPGRHVASRSSDGNLPPLGQRFRLRSSFDISGFGPETQVILTALKEYGMMLADNGGPWYITGAPDVRWSSAVVTDFRKVLGSNFEAVDTSSLTVSRDSGEVRQ